MLLQVAALLSLAGFSTWILGAVFGYTEIATIGGAVVVVVGGMITTTGLEYRTGETQIENTTTTEAVEVAVESVGDAEHVATVDVSAQDGSPTAITFSTDGTAMYITGYGGSAVYQYETTTYDVTLASFQRSLDVTAQDTNPAGVVFQNDGTRMFLAGSDNSSVFQYDLSTAWNISTASPAGSFSVSGRTADPRGLAFDPTGESMYVVGTDQSSIIEYQLSTPYDITTASYVTELDTSAIEAAPTAMAFSPDGSRMLIIGEGSDTIYEYELDTAFDLTTATYDGDNFDASGYTNQPSGLDFEDEARKLFLTGRQGAEVHQFDTGSKQTSDSSTTVIRNDYESVEFPTRFPAGVLLMLIGGLLITRKWGEEGGVM